MVKLRTMRQKHNCVLLFEGLEGIEYIVFDTETTGLKPELDYIVQLSGIKYRVTDHVPQEIDRIDLFIRPPFAMDEKVQSIHGITNAFLADKPTEQDVIGQVQAFFGEKPVLVGYNVEFDIGMLQTMYKRCGIVFQYIVALDVLEMARDLVRDTEDHKLGTIATMYQVCDDITFHHAIDDVIATARLLTTFYKEYKKLDTENKRGRLYVNYFYFWNGRNKHQAGIYVDTNEGKMYFSTFQKCWCSSAVDLHRFDMEKMEKEILSRMGISYRDFSRMTEKRFKELKEAGRA